LLSEEGKAPGKGVTSLEGLAKVRKDMAGGAKPAVTEKERAMINDEQVPMWILYLLSACWVFMFIISLLKGGHGSDPILFDVPCGGVVYWTLPTLIVVGMLLVTAYAGLHLLKLNEIKERAEYNYVEGDVRWDKNGVIMYPLVCSLAGISAGLLGIGGGMVLGPLMLEMEMLPTVSSATTAFMILFTSSSTVVQFIVLGMCRFDYTLWYGMMGALGTIVGQQVSGFYMRKYKRQSIIIFALGLIIALSAVVMGLVGGYGVLKDFLNSDWDEFKFRGLCD